MPNIKTMLGHLLCVHVLVGLILSAGNEMWLIVPSYLFLFFLFKTSLPNGVEECQNSIICFCLFFFLLSPHKITVKFSLSLSAILPRQKNQNLPTLPTSHSTTHLHLHEDYQKLFLTYVGLLSFALHHTINNERTNYKRQE